MKTRHLLTLLALGLGLALALLLLLGSEPAAVHAQGPDGVSTYHVALSCTGVPTPCYTTVQAAVDAVDAPDDLVKVAAGVYTSVNVRPRDDVTTSGVVTQVVYISKTVTLRGGYTTTNWTTSDPLANPTTLNAQGQGRVVYITGIINPALEGLRITGGDADGLGGDPISGFDAGGGVYVIDAGVTISGCEVTGNTANPGSGGGVYLYRSDNTTLRGNIISDNTSDWGGGLYLRSSDATLSGNVILSNTGDQLGGGVRLYDSDATLINNVIADNQAGSEGSGLHATASSPRLLHTTIAHNGGVAGSGIHVTNAGLDYSTVTLTNTILNGHTVVGIRVTPGNTATLESTLWNGNTTNSDNSGGAATINRSNDRFGSPAFLDPGSGDYHIGSASAARDAGTDAGVDRDIDGQTRPMGADYDIGADEYPDAALDIVKRPLWPSSNDDEAVVYTIAVTNFGMEDASNVVLTDVLDGWQRATDATSTVGGCSIVDPGWGGRVVCSPGGMAGTVALPGTIPTGTTFAVTLTADIRTTVTVGQAMVNTADVVADEAANSAQATTYVQDCHVRINDDPTEYTSVQAAVDAANSGDLVKVSGICIGASERGGVRQQVYLDKSLTIRGGYNADFSAWDPEANPTILNAQGQGRVVYITGEIASTMESLRITGGDATGLGGDPASGFDVGGGVYVTAAGATISGCEVINNTAPTSGGGVYLYRSNNTTLRGNTMSDNTADYGGGLYLRLSDAALSGNVIVSNAADYGGGVRLYYSDATLINNVIADNQAGVQGSGLYVTGSSPRLLHTTIARNSGGDGSGLLITNTGSDYSTADLTNTILVNHTVGITVTAGNTATLESTLWNGNTTDSDGGGTIDHSNDQFGAPAFVDPNAGDYHIGNASAARDAGTDAGVSRDIDGQIRPMGNGYEIGADEYPGAGLDVAKRSSPLSVNGGEVVTYTITIASIGMENASNVVLTDTLDGWQRVTDVTSTVGTCSVVDPGWGGRAVCSPGTIATGSTVVVTLTAEVSTTVTGGQVVVNTADVVGDETANSAQATTYVQDCQARINDDPTEYTSVQAAVDAANSGDLVKVSGICTGASERGGMRQHVYLDKNLTIRGGYNADFSAWDPEANPTILNAQGQGRVFYIIGDINPTVESLRITGGDATGLNGDPDNPGVDVGGGVYVIYADVTISGCEITSNATPMSGGGVYLYDSDNSVLRGNTISDNTADYGGGLYLRFSDAALSGNVIVSNAADYGGGVRLYDSDATLTNNVIADNQAGVQGSGLYVTGSSPRLLHTTIARNTGGEGSGILVTSSASNASSVVLTNTILVSHTVGITVTVGNTVTLESTLWNGNTTDSGGGGTINPSNDYRGSPAFVDPDAGDYHIGAGSAALDAGIDAGVSEDVDGESRPMGHGYDIGADELRIGLMVTKHVHPDPVQAGEHLTYTIRVTNTGELDLHAAITDTLPTHVMPGGTLTWTSIVIAPVGVWTQTVVVTAEIGYAGPLTNRVEITTDEGPSGVAIEVSQAAVTPAVAVVKEVYPDPVQAGQQLMYTIRVTNTGNIDLNATVTDRLPDHTTPGGTLTWPTIIAAPGGVWTQTVVATADIGYAGPLTNVVKVTTTEGATATYTETSVVIPRPPGVPTLSAPPNGTIMITPDVTFAWLPGPGGAPDGYNLDLDGTVVTTTDTTSATVLSRGVHTWTVRAYNTTGYSDWASTQTVEITDTLQPPGVPILLSPPNGTITTTPDISFAWQPGPGGAPDGYNLDLDGTVITTTDTTSATVLSMDVHTWTVRAYNATGYSDWASTWTVEVTDTLPPNQPPYTPSHPDPADGATDVPTTPILSWQGGDPDGDAVTYIVAFGTSDPPPFATTTTLTNYTPATLIANTTYHWVITATDGISTSVGPIWHFTTVEFIYLPLAMRDYS